jgi:anti-sigma factor RsiW
MHDIDHTDHELHALVDHQLDDADMVAALERLAADPEVSARCTAYAEQREGLMALRDGLSLSLPSPALAAMTRELDATAHRHEQMYLAAVAVGGVMALMGVLGYAGRSTSDREAEL